jgi:hypothetical protein
VVGNSYDISPETGITIHDNVSPTTPIINKSVYKRGELQNGTQTQFTTNLADTYVIKYT